MSRGTVWALTALAAWLGAFSLAEDNALQIPGHKFKTAKNCERKAPVGKFDRKCDIPVVGWRGAEGLWLPSVSQGAPGGFGF